MILWFLFDAKVSAFTLDNNLQTLNEMLESPGNCSKTDPTRIINPTDFIDKKHPDYFKIGGFNHRCTHANYKIQGLDKFEGTHSALTAAHCLLNSNTLDVNEDKHKAFQNVYNHVDHVKTFSYIIYPNHYSSTQNDQAIICLNLEQPDFFYLNNLSVSNNPNEYESFRTYGVGTTPNYQDFKDLLDMKIMTKTASDQLHQQAKEVMTPLTVAEKIPYFETNKYTISDYKLKYFGSDSGHLLIKGKLNLYLNSTKMLKYYQKVLALLKQKDLINSFEINRKQIMIEGTFIYNSIQYSGFKYSEASGPFNSGSSFKGDSGGPVIVNGFMIGTVQGGRYYYSTISNFLKNIKKSKDKYIEVLQKIQPHFGGIKVAYIDLLNFDGQSKNYNFLINCTPLCDPRNSFEKAKKNCEDNHGKIVKLNGFKSPNPPKKLGAPY
jgi:hypothetical protein